MQLALAFWNVQESANKAVIADPCRHIAQFVAHHDVAFVLQSSPNGNGAQADSAEKILQAVKDQYRVDVACNAVDPGPNESMSCFVKVGPATNVTSEVHLHKLAVLDGGCFVNSSVPHPVVAALAAWDKTISKVYDLRVGAWYARRPGAAPAGVFQQIEPLLQKQRVVLTGRFGFESKSATNLAPQSTDRCYNYSPFQVVEVANGATEGDSSQIVVTINL